MPNGLIAPIPVMTTLLATCQRSDLLDAVDQSVDRVVDRDHRGRRAAVLGLLAEDLDVELVLEDLRDLHEVERSDVEVLELRVERDHVRLLDELLQGLDDLGFHLVAIEYSHLLLLSSQ